MSHPAPIILIVEDHARLRHSLRDWLTPAFKQGRLVEARNGLEAIEKVQEQSPQIVILDIDLPHLDSLEASRRIKTLAPDTQVVMLTMYEDQAHHADAAAAGVDAYVSKSELESELIPTLEALLAES